MVFSLGRFVFHQFTSTKLENKVTFPVEGLDMSDFLCPGVSSDELSLVYDLQSCVCHFGGKSSSQILILILFILCGTNLHWIIK